MTIRTSARHVADTLKQVPVDQGEAAKGAELLLLGSVLHQYIAGGDGIDTDVLEVRIFSRFVDRFPTIKVLALAFLILVGGGVDRRVLGLGDSQGLPVFCDGFLSRRGVAQHTIAATGVGPGRLSKKFGCRARK